VAAAKFPLVQREGCRFAALSPNGSPTMLAVLGALPGETTGAPKLTQGSND